MSLSLSQRRPFGRGVNAPQKKSAGVRNTGAQVRSVRSRHRGGRGGKSTLSIVLKPSMEYCSEGKQYLDRDGLLIPSSIFHRYSEPVPLNANGAFHGPLNGRALPGQTNFGFMEGSAMKRLAFAALAAIACSIIPVSAQAAPVSGVGKLASASQASSLVDHVRWCHRHYYRPVFWHRCHRHWWR